mmetsp:Transcript_15390/g.23846  ORF Transcript_15390/g.23846 Transcript_15390/m.23846 type:complete len:182 (-) Transcript_15390:804-1349(-)
MCRTEKATQGNRTSKDVKYKNETAASKDCSSLRYCSGMAMASIFSLTYVVAPVWMFVAVIYLIKSPFSQDAWLFALPVFLSMIIDPPQMPWILNHMAPVLDYFQYEDIMETSNDEIFDMVNNKKKRILFAATPHGVVGFGYSDVLIHFHVDLFLLLSLHLQHFVVGLVFVWGSLPSDRRTL